MKIGTAVNFFDEFRLFHWYVLAEDCCFSVTWFTDLIQLLYSNILAVQTVISQYFYHKLWEKPWQFQKLALVKELITVWILFRRNLSDFNDLIAIRIFLFSKFKYYEILILKGNRDHHRSNYRTRQSNFMF